MWIRGQKFYRKLVTLPNFSDDFIIKKGKMNYIPSKDELKII